MHIVIPMAGVGQRFIDAGWSEPKPLIHVDGKAIVEHACDMFPSEKKFTFICNEKHLNETNMREELISIRPSAKIVKIPNHTKGPVFSVLAIADSLDDDEELIINYCDFGIYWDYSDFLKHTRQRDADAALICYNKFHPHMFSGTNYAVVSDKEQWMEEIKEKEPIDKAMRKYVSNGTFYFKRAGDFKKYAQLLIEKNITYNDEYYVSLIYNLLQSDGLRTSIYNIQHMLQWGVPEEVNVYNMWSEYFKKLSLPSGTHSTIFTDVNIIPILDETLTFEEVGYTSYEKIKLLEDVSGKEMLIQAVNSLPLSEKKIFLLSEQYMEDKRLVQTIEETLDNMNLIPVVHSIDDSFQALFKQKNFIEEDTSFIMGINDGMILYDEENLFKLKECNEVIIFTKNNLSCGIVYFKNKTVLDELQTLLSMHDLLSLLEYQTSMKITTFEVDAFISWKTPFLYESYKYWQSFFHKVEWHPYTLEKDIYVNKEKIIELNHQYRTFEQAYR